MLSGCLNKNAYYILARVTITHFVPSLFFKYIFLVSGKWEMLYLTCYMIFYITLGILFEIAFYQINTINHLDIIKNGIQ